MFGKLSEPFDVAIVGGGPAGATVGTFLARRGRRVVLFEKARHPRFHIGESLLPQNLPILERLGVAEQVASIGVYKPGAELISPDHDARQWFRFGEALRPAPDHAYQVERAKFDEILLRNARESGVSVREDCAVTSADFDPDECRLTYEENGQSGTCRARFVIDASGRDGFLGRKIAERRRNRSHNSAAMFAHFENVPASIWTRPGNILIFWFEHGWMWFIPLQSGLTSVGAVCMPDYLKTRRGSLEDFFLDTLRLCPKAWDGVRDARVASPVRGAGNYSYKAERPFGDRYLLLGDAYAFVDPVFSSGVYIAMSSAEMAAASVDESLKRPDRTQTILRKYQRRADMTIERFSWFIYRFNTSTMRNIFMAPRDFLKLRSAVITVVSGDVTAPGLVWRLAVFKLLFNIFRLVEHRTTRLWAERKRGMQAISMPENEVAEKF
jgi:flavin-dependent dehydrogenase